ncbi:hypothetical protein [Pseudomonas sp. B33.4]|uniref:hypothetical protein n=1 Tax=Pseudomonas sp. B33.4 TaxID=3104265 RepID=UPI002ADEF85A|nr:hypothetical protein [Pseudomonas sp. B33.4]
MTAATPSDFRRQPVAGQLQLPFVQLLDIERLIEKYVVWVVPGAYFAWLADTKRDPFERQPGETRAIAACRAIVAAKIGNTVSVPAELIQL